MRSARRWWRPRLRTVLLLINLLVLVLPLASIAALRVYESALIRQTESELIAQGAFIDATYGATFARLLARERGRAAAETPEDYGNADTYRPPRPMLDLPWKPRAPVLDLAGDAVLPPPPEPDVTDTVPDALATGIGRELNPVIRDAQFATLAGIRIVDFRGVIVASTFQGEIGRSLLSFEEITHALSGEPVSRLRAHASTNIAQPAWDSISRGAHVRVFVSVPIVRDGRVLGAALLVRTPANIKQAVYGKRDALLSAALLLLGVVLSLSLLTSLTISRPLRAVIAQAHRAARGERGAVTPLRHPGTREIGELSETVAAMATTLESRSAYIRDFAAHVSHEFKTPLTAIQGAVELLRDHGGEMSDEERSRFLGILAQDGARLERLVRRLLELARADMAQPGAEGTPLAAALDAVVARHREAGLSIELGANPELRVRLSADTVDALFGTLLDNARQHAGAGTRVRIESRRESEFAVVELADDGCGISAANAAKVFDPFFTTGRARGSTGLGLAIVRSLLATQGGSVELLPGTKGAAFRLRLPLDGPV